MFTRQAKLSGRICKKPDYRIGREKGGTPDLKLWEG